MDPFSQAVTGAALAGIFSAKPKTRIALFLGAMGGMAPDLDIVIRSASDPLLMIEYHRHFTHALAFSPVGGLICALFFWLFPPIRKALPFAKIFLYCFLGYFTHGLLDACTGYGTHLLWPLTDARESWNIVGVIDPFYTVPALVLLAVAFVKRAWIFAAFSVGWMLAYLALGAAQEAKAREWAHIIASEESEITYKNITVRPTIGNLWLWRILYLDPIADEWQVHALHIPFWGGQPKIYRGERIARYRVEPSRNLQPASTAYADLQRFAFFSDDYLSFYGSQKGLEGVIGDVRYSMTPNSTQPIWGITLPQKQIDHVHFHRFDREVDWDTILTLLKGEGGELIH